LLNISERPVFIEYKSIYLKKKSGELKSVSGDLKKSVIFNSGNIVKAESNSFDEKLGVILNLLSIISDSHYEYVSGLIYSKSDELERILLSEHFITKSDLRKAKEYRTRRIAVTSFSMVGGSWEFEEYDSPGKRSSDISIPVQNIIYEGGKRDEVCDYFRSKYAFHSPEINKGSFETRGLLSIDELEFYRFLDKNRELSNREIISKGNISPNEYWRMLSVLFLLNLVQFRPRKNIDYIEDDLIALLNIKRSIEENSPEIFKILKIEKDDPVNIVKDKFKLAIEKFDPERFGSALAPEIKKTAEFVRENLKLLLKTNTLMPNNNKRKDESDRSGEVETESISNMKSSPDIENNIQPEKENVGEDENSPGEKRSEILKNAADLYERRHFDEAIPMLKDILRVKKDDFDILLLLGKCQLNVEFFTDEALRNLSRAIELKPANTEAVFFLGELFKKTKKIKKAAKCFSRVLELQPDHYMAKREIEKIKTGSIKKKKKRFFGR